MAPSQSIILTFAQAILLVSAQTIDYRLPQLSAPSSYELALSLPREAFTASGNEFSGTVTIRLTFANVTDQIALHAQHDFITIDRVTFSNVELPSGNYSINNVTDILTIDVGDVTTGTPYDLAIEYTGVLSTGDMYGVYKSSYVDGNGTTKYLVTNQFAATFARRAFPCFDEPALKATFDFSITVPTGLNVLFNTRPTISVSNDTTGLTTVIFNKTPRMSTYLVAFIASEYTCTTGASIGTVPYQVCSRNESAATRDLAIEYGPKLLAALNNFTNYDYSLGVRKLDQVAIPDFPASAMENWGLITYREASLLWDKNESSNRYKQRVVTVVAHEMSHQWFGDLVTLKWWSEIFMNEGFATYFEYHIPHEVLPEWELDKHFVIEELHTALLTDSLENAHALQSPTSTPAEIISKFSTISYKKGGSVLRMVQHFMHLDNFRAGIQNYLSKYALGNVEPEDLWSVLNQSVAESVSKLPANLSTVMGNWTTQPGFPLLTVSLNGSDVVILQERFLLSGQTNDTKWYVPITYTTSLDANKFQDTTPNTWLTPDDLLRITLPENFEWIILNNQQTGYYRVNYDSSLWDRIKMALLRSNFDGITELNRAQIVDDLFNLARANKIRYSTSLDIVGFLRYDTSYYPWFAALSGFNFLLRRVGDTSVLGQAISLNILDLMGDLYLSVPISTLNEDDQIYTFRQELALSWTCRLGAANCIESAKTALSLYRSSGKRPNRNLRSTMYCNALRYSTDPSDWGFLWDAYTSSADLATEQITILAALGCTRNETLLTGYLTKSIANDSGIRPQDGLTVFSSVYTSNSVGVDVAFEFLVKNHEAIAAKYQSMNSLGNLLKGIAERFTTQEQVTRLRNFTESATLTEDFKVAANEALEVAEGNLRWLEQFEADLNSFYKISGAGTIFASSLTIILSLVCLVIAK